MSGIQYRLPGTVRQSVHLRRVAFQKERERQGQYPGTDTDYDISQPPIDGGHEISCQRGDNQRTKANAGTGDTHRQAAPAVKPAGDRRHRDDENSPGTHSQQEAISKIKLPEGTGLAGKDETKAGE